MKDEKLFLFSELSEEAKELAKQEVYETMSYENIVDLENSIDEKVVNMVKSELFAKLRTFRDIEDIQYTPTNVYENDVKIGIWGTMDVKGVFDTIDKYPDLSTQFQFSEKEMEVLLQLEKNDDIEFVIGGYDTSDIRLILDEESDLLVEVQMFEPDISMEETLEKFTEAFELAIHGDEGFVNKLKMEAIFIHHDTMTNSTDQIIRDEKPLFFEDGKVSEYVLTEPALDTLIKDAGDKLGKDAPTKNAKTKDKDEPVK